MLFFFLDDIMGRGVLDIFLLHSCSCTFRNQNLSTSVHILSTLTGVIALDWSLHKPINLYISTSGNSITIFCPVRFQQNQEHMKASGWAGNDATHQACGLY